MIDLLTAFEPYFVEALSTVVALAITAASLKIRAWTGIKIEAVHRDALHEAIMSGIEASLDKNASAGLEAITDGAIKHAKASVPDAIKALVPGDGVLEAIALRYANQITGSR